MQEELSTTTQRVASLNQGFHIGGRPDIFGSEGEEPMVLGPKAARYGPPEQSRCRRNDRMCMAKQNRANQQLNVTK